MASKLMSVWVGGNEGFVSTWYLDPVNIPTIGYGFTWESDVFRDWWMKKYGRKFKRGDTISRADSDVIMGLILDRTALPAVERVMPGQRVNVKEAAADMVYNAGAGSLKWRWAQFFAQNKIKEGADALRVTARTGRGSKKILPGLARRRQEEANLAETGSFPKWVMDRAAAPSAEVTVPGTYLSEVEVREAQMILNELGYEAGVVDGIPGARTVAAVKRFQTEHGTLKVDGILGRATLTALYRVRDAKRKGVVVAGSGAGTAAGGGVVEGTGAGSGVDVPATPVAPSGDLGWVGDLLIWGGLAFLVLGLAYLAWRYRDELPAIIRRFA